MPVCDALMSYSTHTDGPEWTWGMKTPARAVFAEQKSCLCAVLCDVRLKHVCAVTRGAQLAQVCCDTWCAPHTDALWCAACHKLLHDCVFCSVTGLLL